MTLALERLGASDNPSCYHNHMRYAASLRTSHRHHILKRRGPSGLISFAALTLALIVVLVFADRANLSLGALLAGFLASLVRTTIAYCLSLLIALALALFITINTKVENLLLPVFDVLQSFPSFALFPALVSALAGAPEIVIIGVLTITMVWPLMFTIIGGIKNRRVDLEEAATVFGAYGFKRLRWFTLPELTPAIITGSIVSWGEGWEFIIGAELLVKVNSGIGQYLGALGNSHQNTLLAFGIVVLMLLLFLVNKIVWLPLLHKVTKYQAES